MGFSESAGILATIVSAAIEPVASRVLLPWRGSMEGVVVLLAAHPLSHNRHAVAATEARDILNACTLPRLNDELRLGDEVLIFFGDD